MMCSVQRGLNRHWLAPSNKARLSIDQSHRRQYACRRTHIPVHLPVGMKAAAREATQATEATRRVTGATGMMA